MIPKRVLLLLGLILSSVLFCGLALLKGWVRPDTLQQTVSEAGSWAIFAYILGVFLMELLWLPRMWGLLAGGVLFGPV